MTRRITGMEKTDRADTKKESALMNTATAVARTYGRLGRITIASVLSCLVLVGVVGAGTASAAVGPAIESYTTWGDTNLEPGGKGQITVHLHNVGDEDAKGPLSIFVEVPEGVTIEKVVWDFGGIDLITLAANFGWCDIEGRILDCTYPEFFPEFIPNFTRLVAPGVVVNNFFNPPQPSGWSAPIYIDVAVSPDASGVGVNTVRIEGGGDPTPEEEVVEMPFDSTPAPFGVATFMADVFKDALPFEDTVRQAGDHPFEQRVDFELNMRTGVDNSDGKRYVVPNGALKTVEVTLPRGMIGNPEAIPKCDPALFALNGVTGTSTQCPSNTQVGYLNIHVTNTTKDYGRGGGFFTPTPDNFLSRTAIYNLEPPKGVPADFGFTAASLVQGHIYPLLDPAQNYAIKTVTPEIAAVVQPTGSEVVFWGVPGDPAHDKFRYFTGTKDAGEAALGASFEGAGIRPLLTNPSDCGFDNGGARIRVESYNRPGHFSPVQEYGDPLNVNGCDDQRLRFKPQVAIQPENRDAGGATGLTVNLEVPLRNDEVADAEELYAANGEVKGISTPPMKKAVVTFPEGMTLNPAGAQGLGHCTPEQIGLGTDRPVRCPDNSQYGTLTLHTPLLPIDEQPEGWVYVAQQENNPFHNFLSLYLVIQEPDRGILVKIAGRVDLDPRTGQVTATFDDLPQFPMSNMQMRLKGGQRAGLVNPKTCGTKTIVATFYSWHDPTTPRTVNSNYEITRNPDGSPCLNRLAERPFEPSLSGGTVNNLAGSFSPMELSFARSDEEQELGGVEGTGPPGLLASLRGVGRCTDAAIAAAAAPGRSGRSELTAPSCPASSLVGRVDAAAGVGQALTWVSGKVYLAGPYKGAPLSGVAIVPAIAGPFDVGTIVTRAPAYVNPKTAELRLVTDDLPQIFKGIPVRVREIRVHVDRPNFTLNPTNCSRFSLVGKVFSSEGKQKLGGSPFQAADCASLGFKPRLFARLFGGTKRGAHPKFRGVYVARNGDANASSATVTLPRSVFLDQSNIKTVCTRVQFAADACPRGAIYGRAVAHTPLLDEPLKGPVYLRSSNNKLPDLVADLRGIVDVEVSGRIDSVRGGIRAHFNSIPDGRVSKFVITMQGGRKGLLVNSRDICKRAYRMSAAFVGQNGKKTRLRPKLNARCGSKRHGKRDAKRASDSSGARAGG